MFQTYSVFPFSWQPDFFWVGFQWDFCFTDIIHYKWHLRLFLASWLFSGKWASWKMTLLFQRWKKSCVEFGTDRTWILSFCSECMEYLLTNPGIGKYSSPLVGAFGLPWLPSCEWPLDEVLSLGFRTPKERSINRIRKTWIIYDNLQAYPGLVRGW